ncbi:MAG: hypothetical protein HXX11_14645 [Desulfuromonadales bacterium]|nr:hypothetical protein [Desulfuromonadales bacterium]
MNLDKSRNMSVMAGLKLCLPSDGYVFGGEVVLCLVSIVIIGIIAIDMYKLIKK